MHKASYFILQKEFDREGILCKNVWPEMMASNSGMIGREMS